MKKINKIVNKTDAMKIDILAKEKIANGEHIYNLAAGDPNLSPSKAIFDAYIEHSPAWHNYIGAGGLSALKAKIWPKNTNEVMLADGCKELIYISLLATCKPHDTVILIGPCWSSYIEICKMLHLKYILLAGSKDKNYIPDLKDILDELGSHEVSAILINNPNNPTGVIYSEDYLKQLETWSEQYKFWLISDEIYSELIYIDTTFYSLEGHRNCITLNGLSKSQSIPGWRFGWAIGEEEVIKEMTAIQSQLSGPPNTLIETIINKAWENLDKPDIYEYKKRIDLLSEIPIFNKHKPFGGFYFYIPVENDDKITEELLSKYNIAVTPGKGYGINNTIRVSIASVTYTELLEIKPILEKVFNIV